MIRIIGILAVSLIGFAFTSLADQFPEIAPLDLR
jgi:hypothetical protein